MKLAMALISLILVGSVAAAQPAAQAPSDYTLEALAQTLTETMAQLVQWRARALAAEAKLAAMETEAKKSPNPASPAGH